MLRAPPSAPLHLAHPVPSPPLLPLLTVSSPPTPSHLASCSHHLYVLSLPPDSHHHLLPPTLVLQAPSILSPLRLALSLPTY